MSDAVPEAVPDKPSGGRHQIVVDTSQPQLRREKPEQLRRFGDQQRMPTISDTREWTNSASPEWAHSRIRLILQCPTSARHQPDIGPAFMQQCRKLDGRRTAADDRDIATAEALELRVVSAMRGKLARQGGKHSRHIAEGVETDCNEEPSGG